MPKLKNLSAKEVISILEKFGFAIVGQRGRHIKLRRTTDRETRQTLTIPDHKELDRGTLKAIHNQALRYISEVELREYFYTEE